MSIVAMDLTAGFTLLPIMMVQILKLEKTIQSGIGLQVAKSKRELMILGQWFVAHQEFKMLLFLAKTNTTSLTYKVKSKSLQELPYAMNLAYLVVMAISRVAQATARIQIFNQLQLVK